jgi:uncharacterized protein
MLLASLPVRVLGPGAGPVIDATLQADPYVSCMVAARLVRNSRLSLGGEFWGINGGRAGLCYSGPNLVPLSGDERALRAFAGMAGRRVRQSAAVCGRQELVLPLWEHLERRWGPARAIRADQPFMVHDGDLLVEPDPGVGSANISHLDTYFAAAVAMFTEEIGVDPRVGDGGRSYRARVSELIELGRAFVRFDEEGIAFKAEVGAMSKQAALIQGVWVAPRLRGQGISEAGIAAVVRTIRGRWNRMPCLYVNDFNTAARAAYQRVGFRQIATYSSVLL